MSDIVVVALIAAGPALLAAIGGLAAWRNTRTANGELLGRMVERHITDSEIHLPRQ